MLKERRRAPPALHASQKKGSTCVLTCEGFGNPMHLVESSSNRRALECANLAWIKSSSMIRVDRMLLVCEDINMYGQSKDMRYLVPADASFM